MWYREARARVLRAKVAVDRLWEELDKTDVPQLLGVDDRESFLRYLGEDEMPTPDAPAFAEPEPPEPPPPPRDEHREDANDAYLDARRRQRKKRNLNLDDVLDVGVDDDGKIMRPITPPIVDPSDDKIPEEAAVEQGEAESFPEEYEAMMRQLNFEMLEPGNKLPQVHEGCRCTLRPLGMAYQWLLADSAACPVCQANAAKFNALSNPGL